MAKKEVTTSARSQVLVNRATQGDLEMAAYGMSGIFWALNMLVVQGAADDIAREHDLRNGIANLIIAGQELSNEITGRF